MKSINVNFISLKCLLFFFFGGLGCLLPFLPLHMRSIGLTADECRIIAIVTPCFALFGPLLAGPLCDRLRPLQAQSTRQRPTRTLLIVLLILGAIAYSMLLLVPRVSRLHAINPVTVFTCRDHEASVIQQQCLETPCYDWPPHKVGTLFLSNCLYDCDGSTVPLTPSSALENSTSDDSEPEDEEDDIQDEERRKRDVDLNQLSPPHLCFKSKEKTLCHVYTAFGHQIAVNVSLTPSAGYLKDWCKYNVGNEVSCQLPSKLGPECNILCDIDDPYSHSESLLAESHCKQTIGDPQLTFWSYLLIRSVADVFPTTCLALLDNVIVIATRDTTGLVGRQFVFAALGLALFPPVITLASPYTNLFAGLHDYATHVIAFALLSGLAALILIFDRSMPLSPVDYWLHSGSGYLSHFTLRGAGGECAALLMVLVLLGALWSALDSYLPWHLILELRGTDLLLALTLTVGALPAVALLWNAETVVEFCGHSNILISAFTFYIIRYTGLLFFTNASWVLLCEVLEVFTLGIVWVTAVLYLRHLVPRHLTATGQACAVIAHFCFGRSLGAVLGGVLSFNTLYATCAIVSAVIASLYFVIYHCCLKPRCLKPATSRYRSPNQSTQETNANGTYTPLKVYSQGDKGQFRY